MPMDFWTLVSIVAGSSVISAVVTIGVDTYRRQRTSKRHNSLLAMQLAFLFEDYAINCASALSDHDMADQSQGAAGKNLQSIPTLLLLPEEDYKEFDQEMLAQVLDFPQRIRMADEEAGFYFEVEGEESALACNYRSTVTLAARALDIGAAMRRAYNLPQRNLVYGKFDVREYLEEEAKKIATSEGSTE